MKLTTQELGMLIGDLGLLIVRHSSKPQSRGVINKIVMKPNTTTLQLHVYFNGLLDILDIRERLFVESRMNEAQDMLEVRMLYRAGSPKGYSLVFYKEEG